MGIYDIGKNLKVAEEHYKRKPDPWDIVSLFEERIAAFCGSKYAVALDSCTNALYLCIKYHQIKNNEISIPKQTYLSVPQLILHSGNRPIFRDEEWSGNYRLGKTNIFDAAGRLKPNMYIDDSFMCLSFHLRKCLPIGKGGMILLNSHEAYKWMQLAVYEGRDRRVPHDSITDIDINGWNMYMTPEEAAYGIDLLEDYIDQAKEFDYPDCTYSSKYVDVSSFSFLKS